MFITALITKGEDQKVEATPMPSPLTMSTGFFHLPLFPVSDNFNSS